MKKVNLVNIFGGWERAVNGSYWLTKEECETLKKAGFKIGGKDLLGWKHIELGICYIMLGDFPKLIMGTFGVNNPEGKRATSVEIMQILGPETR